MSTMMEPQAEMAVVGEPQAIPDVEVIDGIEVIDHTANEQEAEMTTKKKASKKAGTKAAAPKAKGAPASKATAAKATKETAKAATKKASGRNPKPGELTLGRLVGFYTDELSKLGKSPKTIASYAADLRIAVRHFGDEAPVASLTAKQVGAYFDSPAVCANRKGGKRNQITIDKVRRTFRMALERLAEIGILAEAPIPEKGDAKAK